MIKFKPWQVSTVASVGIVTSLCAAAAVYQPHFGLPLLLGPLLLAWNFWYGSRVIRMEVTPAVVRARQGRFRGRPDLEADKVEICRIDYCPRRIVFRGTHGQSLMAPYPFWALEQVVQVAGALDVPIYDHRGKFRLKTLTREELAEGHLVKGDSLADWYGSGHP